MKAPLSPVCLLEVGLAVAYGAVLGTWLPVPGRAPVYALPPAVVTAPLLALPDGGGAGEGGAWAPPAGWGSAGTLELSVTPAAAPKGPPTSWAADTLPAAPDVAVPTYAGSSGVGAPAAAGASGQAAARLGRPLGPCAILVEGEEVPPECRRERRWQTRSACPAPGESPRGVPIICMRAED